MQFREGIGIVSEFGVKMTHLAQARKVFDIELAALKAVRAQLDGAFPTAVEMVV